ncbi:MAG: DUF72 domain-containing protein [Gemmatimonadaceae bacterium]|nr:DUF72 domain-containing protein [Gemmatimonadaceae bacterium]
MPLHFGCQGWNYPDWVGPFYPPGTRRDAFLRTYARAFSAVEIDATFYAIPPIDTVRRWAAQVPPGFLFCPKLPQAITHERRFRDVAAVQAAFFDTMRALGDRLGIVLCQCAPDFAPDQFDAFAAWLPTLPRDVPVAVEFRHKGWITREVHQLCTDHGVAIALSDGRWVPRGWLLKLAERPTAAFDYVRFMGPDRTLTRFDRTQRDMSEALAAWTPALRTIAARAGGSVACCNNHFAGHAPATLRTLQSALGQTPVAPASLADQGSLFG